MSTVSLSGVQVSLGGRKVLAGVDLTVSKGEFVGVVGPNGAGKTTILKAMIGAVPATGDVVIGGRPLATMDRAARARQVAMLPQRPEVPHEMRVIDYVLLGRSPHLGYFSVEGRSDLEAAANAIASLELTELSGRRLGALSGGELQRAVLARALAQASPILLLDEPTSALDVGHAQQVLDLVDGIRRSCELTVVATLHDLTLAAQFCDRLIMIADGRIVAEGSPRSVLTEGTIRAHYGAAVRVLDDGRGGVVVIPVRDSRLGAEDASMAALP
jgi:iron complex transport system ATP-binding protein